MGANLEDVKIDMADFTGAHLEETRLYGAKLSHAIFSNSHMGRTQLIDVDLSSVLGLSTVRHHGPSEISLSTFYKSRGNIPEVFLQGCGVPQTFIDNRQYLLAPRAIEYYSAFISYSAADEHFARRLHNDLQMNGVRVWFAPEDLKIGDPLRQTIDEAVRLYDKLILVLSENSINRAWVRHEFSKAIEKEKQHNRLMLFPIRIDDSVFETTEQWAYDIRQRHIGDFRNWTNPMLYQNAINRLLRDLNARG